MQTIIPNVPVFRDGIARYFTLTVQSWAKLLQPKFTDCNLHTCSRGGSFLLQDFPGV